MLCSRGYMYGDWTIKHGDLMGSKSSKFSFWVAMFIRWDVQRWDTAGSPLIWRQYTYIYIHILVVYVETICIYIYHICAIYIHICISIIHMYRYIVHAYPIGSMYGIYANIWGILMVNVAIYSIHGSYGIRCSSPLGNGFRSSPTGREKFVEFLVVSPRHWAMFRP